MSFNYTYRADDITSWDVDARDLVENRDRELELYSTTIDTSFLNLNASNLTLGTVPTGRMSGSYAGITGLGTLTGLSVSGNVQITGGNLVVGGQGTFFNSSAEDGIILLPRIGGTGSYRISLAAPVLSASRTLTMPNVNGTLITTGNFSDITAVGTLASGSIPASLLTGTTLPATIVTSSLTSVGTITTGTWSGSFGAVSGANLTSLNASNISSGTLANALLPAAATTITSVGTLTALTTTGQVTMTRGALGTTAGNEISFINPNATTTNGDSLDTRLIRNSNGSDWTTAVWRMGRLVDSTRMGFIQFGDGAGNQTVNLGVGTTTYGTINTSGLYVTNEIYATSNIRISTAGANFIAQSPTTGTGNAAQWVSVFGLYILYRNTSTRNDKENFQPLNGIVTANMIDDIKISLWNRKGATGFPEIGPMAEDMDDISPFLSIRGMDCDEAGNIVATAPGGINQNAWLSLLTLGIQDIRQRLQQLETT